MHQIRTYRNWVEDRDLMSFQVKISESDLFIRADRPLNSQAPLDRKSYLTGQAHQSLRYQRRVIQDYIQKNPEFATALEPYFIKDGAPDIIQEMAKASSCADVGPMAAVAGAIAEFIGRELLK